MRKMEEELNADVEYDEVRRLPFMSLYSTSAFCAPPVPPLTSALLQARDLIKVYEKGMPKNGPHFDLWVYRKDTSVPGEPGVSFSDPHFLVRLRPLEVALPVRRVYWKQMGRVVSVPAKPRTWCRLSYGDGFSVATVFRQDCIHNFVNGRLWWSGL